ncbi:putative P0 [Allium polerovirus A]|uniref:P0 n=1 Tax=Allium polerovirus A TaxID=2593979 RepID=A0AAE9NXK9_9VIRU|nr:putative P0 [Allium polerovirus A]
MQFSLDVQTSSLEIRNPAPLSFYAAVQVFAEFIDQLPRVIFDNCQNASFNIDRFIRSFLLGLPLCLGGFLYGDCYRVPARLQPQLYRHTLRTGFHPRFSHGTRQTRFRISLPDTEAATRILLQRTSSSLLSQVIRRCPEILVRGLDDFCRTLSVWTGRAHQADLLRVSTAPLGFRGLHGIYALGGLLDDVANGDPISEGNSLHAIAHILISVLGQAGAVDFWQLANLPCLHAVQNPQGFNPDA